MNTVTAVYTICPLQDLLLEIKDMLHTVVSSLKQGSGSAMRVTCKKEEGGHTTNIHGCELETKL